MSYLRLLCIVLLLASVWTTSALAQFPPMPRPTRGPERKPPPPPPFDRESLFNRLELTAQQRTQMTALLNQFEEKMRQLYTRLHEQRMQLTNLYLKYEIDERSAQKILNSIRQTQDEILKAHHEHHKQLRRILTKEQFERWNDWWKERMFFPPQGDWGRRGRSKPG